MECRAPFQPEEPYQQLRLPNNPAASAGGVMSNVIPNASTLGGYNDHYASTQMMSYSAVAYEQQQKAQQQQQQHLQQQQLQQQQQQSTHHQQQQQHLNAAALGYGATHKLSASASEFVPNFGGVGGGGGGGGGVIGISNNSVVGIGVAGSSGGLQNRLDHKPQLTQYEQQQDRQRQHQQAYFAQQATHQQQQRQGSFFNGYQQQQQQQQHQQQKELQQQQQQQQYQYNNNSVQHLTNSVQDRLRIGGVSGGGGAGNGAVAGSSGLSGIGGGGGHKQHHGNNGGPYFQQNQTHQQQHHGSHQQQQHHQPKHFQKHPHLNHYQHHQQQQQRQHQHSQQQVQHHNNHRHQNQQQQQQLHQQHHNHHHHSSSSSSNQHQQQNDSYYSNNATTSSTVSSNSNNSNADTSNSSHPDMETIALEYLDTVIHCLNQNPGQFDAIAPRFLTIFEGMENNNYVLSIAMEDIFEKSIENPNFRYMGAKLYNLLHMMNPKQDSLFHTLLKCKLDYHQEEVRKFMEHNQQQKVRETALFLAELYMQLRGEDTRIHLIAENIVYSLMQLLARENSENVRCICLTLKLAGYDLTNDCPDEMQDIIIKLDTINLNAPGKYPLAANVIQLQKNNWGRKVSNSLGEGDLAKPPEPLRLSDEPVFYGPDGRELTAEETDFLAGEGEDDDDDDDVDDDGDMGDLDPEMDEETERDYKNFLKQQKIQEAATAAGATSTSRS